MRPDIGKARRQLRSGTTRRPLTPATNGSAPTRSGPNRSPTDPTKLTWWEDLWPSFRPCAVLSNTPLDLPTYELIRVNRSAYRQYLFFGRARPMYLYGAHLADVRPAPSS